MAIDLSSELPVPLSDVPSLPCIPRRRGGRKLHRSTPFRWAHAGVKGVHLEVIRVGGTLCTSVAALQRFFEQLAESTPAVHSATKPLKTEHDRVERELDTLGVIVDPALFRPSPRRSEEHDVMG